MDENKFWLSIWSLVAGSILTVILLVCLFTYLGQKDLIKGGFVRKVVLGYSQPTWTKE